MKGNEMKLQDSNGKRISFEDGVIYIEDDGGSKTSVHLDRSSMMDLVDAMLEWANKADKPVTHHSFEAKELTVDQPKLKI